MDIVKCCLSLPVEELHYLLLTQLMDEMTPKFEGNQNYCLILKYFFQNICDKGRPKCFGLSLVYLLKGELRNFIH